VLRDASKLAPQHDKVGRIANPLVVLRSPRGGRLEARTSLIVALAIAVCGSTSSYAQTSPPLSIAVNAGAASGYAFRGVDQTDGRAEGFGGLDLSRGQLYIGTWASNVDLKRLGDDRASAEVDAYGGWRPSLFGYDLDVGAIAYTYVDPAERETYVEAYGKASRAIGPLSAGVSIYASPQYPRAAGAGAYIEGRASYDLTRKLTLAVALGHQYEAHALGPAPCLPTAAGCTGSYSDLDYADWSLGGSYAVNDRIAVDLRYTDTDAHRLGEAYHARVALTARASFP
jgi:uncharacterized protein (TIGR02001 family)